jgi:hypothetical protein
VPEVILDFCPACKDEVEYEIDLELDGKRFCSVCGRTKEMAEKGIKAEQLIIKRKAREKFTGTLWRRVFYFGLAVFAAFFVFGFISDPERVFAAAKEKFLATVGLSIIALIIAAIVFAAYSLVKRLRNR